MSTGFDKMPMYDNGEYYPYGYCNAEENLALITHIEQGDHYCSEHD